ncbi:acyl carrier protein [Spirillospora sp. NPDC046719]
MASSTAAPTTAPSSAAITRDLARIRGELLGLSPDRIDGESSLLRLGGDSVLTVRMAALILRRLSVGLALSEVTVEITRSYRLVTRRSGDSGTVRALPVEIEHRADPDAPFP